MNNKGNPIVGKWVGHVTKGRRTAANGPLDDHWTTYATFIEATGGLVITQPCEGYHITSHLPSEVIQWLTKG